MVRTHALASFCPKETHLNVSWRTPALVVVSGGLILLFSGGIRQTFGLFLYPVTTELGWSRETFAFAIAIQAIVIGLCQPPVGMLADKFGVGRIVAAGAAILVLGLYLMSSVTSPLVWHISAGLMLGLAMGLTGHSVVSGAVARAVPEERRSAALGIAMAGTGVGQFVMIGFGQTLISYMDWRMTLLIFAVLPLCMLPIAFVLAGKGQEIRSEHSLDLKEALGEAAGHRGYLLLVTGFFVCGFQVTFIGAHLPAYVVDSGHSAALGATALAVIGFFNIIGSFMWGRWGGKYSKKNLLSINYLARAVLFTVFASLPATEVTVLIFAVVMGFLWLGTVPLTSALVGQIFGVQYLSTLFGVAFLSHQAGSFLGVWTGGFLFDLTGSYQIVWYLAAVLGLIAALLHWPIDEQQVERLRVARQSA